MPFLGEWVNVVFRCCELLDILVTKEEPTSGHHDVCLVGTPKGASWREIQANQL